MRCRRISALRHQKIGSSLENDLSVKRGRLARPFDEVTEDGTLVYGVVESVSSFDCFTSIPEDDYAIVNGELHMSWQLALQLAKKNPALAEAARVVETYPDGTVVEVTP